MSASTTKLIEAEIVFLSQRRLPPGLTARDLQHLGAWSSEARRVAICNDEMGTFAMIYDEAAPWASWGMVRQGVEILLWDCVTLADIGRFGSIWSALAAVPGAVVAGPNATANILSFAAARLSRTPITSTRPRA